MMDFFSRTLDTYTGSFVARRRRKRLFLYLGALTALLLAGGVFFYIGHAASFSSKEGKAIPKNRILESWRSQAWDDVLASCESSIQVSPLDSFYLAFGGLASFYKGSELPEGEERAALMNQTVVLIRKTFVVADKGWSAEIPRAQLEYVLGKANYFKGSSYWDETAKWLEASVANHYIADDTWEYLAVAWDGLGDKTKALRYFGQALSVRRTDLLLIAAGKAYIDADQDARGESLLLEALARSMDTLTREKCRFLLSSVYLGRNEMAKAQYQLAQVLSENPQSTDAHFRLGLLLQKQGDTVGARAEWRRAVAIDPMNLEARQKLTEKL